MDSIEQLREKRNALETEVKALFDAADAEERKVSEEEVTKATELRKEIKELDERVIELAGQEVRKAKAEAAVAKLHATPKTSTELRTDDAVYTGKGQYSYFQDLMRVSMPGSNDVRAAERLAQHAEQAPRIFAEYAKRDEMFSRAEQESRAISRGDTAGGTFVPPLWQLSDYAGVPRFGRVTADLVPNYPLPPGTDSINVPTITTGSLTGFQATEGDTVTSRDLITSSVSGAVGTIAGQMLTSVQLIDQSPLAGGIDGLVFGDLAADYNIQLDKNVIGSYVTAGTYVFTGINNVASINLVTWSGTTVATFYSTLLGALNSVETNRNAPAEVIVGHPRRWYWLLSQVDSQNRPLAVPAANGTSVNTMAGGIGLESGEGFKGYVGGLPFYADGNVGTAYGVSSDEDRLYVMKVSDLRLFESSPRSRVLFETDANTLQARFQLWNYAAFIGNRLPKAIARIAGSGFNLSNSNSVF